MMQATIMRVCKETPYVTKCKETPRVMKCEERRYFWKWNETP